MKSKNRFPAGRAIFALLTVVLACGGYLDTPVESATLAAEPRACVSKQELAVTIERFSSTQSFRELEAARVRLMNSAKLSGKCRRAVVSAIMAAMDKPQLDAYRDFNLWRYGSHLLGDLKATEALDLLIKNLSFTDGSSINVTHYPAMEGVIMIGQPGISKLGSALRRNAETSYRFNAVFCIAQIGGREATQELRRALSSEPDLCIRRFINVSIEVLNNSGAAGKMTVQDRDKWFVALSCGSERD
jgi:hypothetical protein